MFSKIFKKQLNFKPHRRFRPVLEALEDRCLPSILPVMNTSDSGVNGDGSLRGEILAAKNGDTIEFANNIGTDIHLLTVKGELPITQNITIQGPGAAKMTVHGSSHRVFEIAAGSTVTIQGLTITEGNPIGDGTPFSSQGGGILNHGNLTLNDDILKNNTALAGSNYDGQGGGVYNDDLLEMDNVQFLENNAIGGDKSGIAGNGQGGGLFNAGQVFIFHCTFDDNLAQGGNALADMGGFAGAGNGEGGGLFNYTFGSVSIFNQSLFEHNFARGGVAEALSAFNGGGEGGGVANDSGSFESVGTTYHFNHAIAGVSDTHDNSVPGTGFGGGLANFDGIMSLLGDVLDSNDADGGSAFGDGFSGGNAQGGGLYTAGGVVELDALLEQNAAEAGGGGKNSFGQGGEGGAALGGGVFSNGTDLNVIQSHFLNNVAVAGMGGDGPVAGGPGGLAQGGGLYLYDDGNAFPSLDAKFDMNQAIGGDSGHKGFGGDAQGGAIYLAKGNLSFTPTTSFTFNGAQGGRGREGETSGATDTPPTSGGFGGNAQGGALYIAVGDVRINHNSFQMNTARGGLGGTGGLGILAFPGGNGGRAEGGAVYQAARPGGAGFLDVRGALFLLNSAFGGDAGPGANGQSVNGGAGGMGGYAQAGGLFAADGLFIKDSLFFRNDADGGFGGSGGDSQGGAGGSGGAGAEADGGGISLSSATATMENVYVLGSIAQGGFGGKGGNGNGAGGSGGNGGFAAGGGLNIVGGVAIITTMTLSNSNLFGGLGGDGGAAQQSGMGGDGGNGGSVLGAGIFSSFSELGLVNGTVSVDGASGGSGGLGGLNGINQRGDGGAGGSAQGGGLYQASGIASISNSTVNDNGVLAGLTFPNVPHVQTPDASGGGLFIDFGTVNVTNSTIALNRTFEIDVNQQLQIAGEGGGLRNIQGAVQLTNDTIVGNGSGVGGGVWALNLTLVNTLIARNFDSFGDPDFHAQPGGNITDQGHNLIGNGGMSIGSFNNSVLVGTPAKPIDPMLGPLADNGGPTYTMALLTGSKAINAGDDALALDASGKKLAFDQRGPGFPRFVGTVDIGAFEVQAGKKKRPPNPQSVPASNLQPLQAITDAIPAPPGDRQF